MNKLLASEEFPHHVLLLFYTLRDQKEMLSYFRQLYQNKLQEQRVQPVANMSKIKFEPNSVLTPLE